MRSRARTVREEQPDDAGAVPRIVAAAFGGEKVPEPLAALRDSVAWLDRVCVVEERDEWRRCPATTGPGCPVPLSTRTSGGGRTPWACVPGAERAR
jgi:hypothetical protein